MKSKDNLAEYINLNIKYGNNLEKILKNKYTNGSKKYISFKDIN